MHMSARNLGVTVHLVHVVIIDSSSAQLASGRLCNFRANYGRRVGISGIAADRRGCIYPVDRRHTRESRTRG